MLAENKPHQMLQKGIPPANSSTDNVLYRIFEWLFLWTETYSLERQHFRCKANSKNKTILEKSNHYNSNFNYIKYKIKLFQAEKNHIGTSIIK